MKYLKLILNLIAVYTLFLIVGSLGEHLLTSKIIEFKWDWMRYFYYLGLWLLTFYATDYILDYHKKD